MKAPRDAMLTGVGFVYVFLLLPTVIVIFTSINSADYLSFPPVGFSLRWYKAFFGSRQFMHAFGISILIGVIVAAMATLIGTPAAIFYVRYLRRGREQFRIAMMAPLLLPEVLTAIALLFAFSHAIGGMDTLVPLIIGHTVITVPFVFLSVSSALYNMTPSVPEAARTLGASPRKTFYRITLPLIKSGIITGAILAFITSFDNFNISLLLKPVGSTTLPILLFDYLRYDFDPVAAAASTVSVLLTMTLLVVLDRFYGLKAVRF